MTVLYGSAVADSGLTTACDMSTSTGGAETSRTTTTTGSNVYAEVLSQGGTSATVTSIPATPTGHGWVFTPGAGSFAAANWQASFTMSVAFQSATTNLTLRFFTLIGGVYTHIADIVTNVTATAKTTWTSPATAFPLQSFATTDQLYIDAWWHDSSTNAGGDNPVFYLSNSASFGVASDLQVTTSAFTSTGIALAATMSGVGTLTAPLLLNTVALTATMSGVGTLSAALVSAFVPYTGLRVQINSAIVDILLQQIPLTFGDDVSQRSTCSFGVSDSVGMTLSENMTITIDDGELGNKFTGFIDRIERMPISGSNPLTTFFLIVGKDNAYLVDKLVYTGDEFTATNAGDAVVRMHAQQLKAEGITASYLQEANVDRASWSNGSLINASANTGKLTLAPSGASASYIYPDTTSFNEDGATFSNCAFTGSIVALTGTTPITRDWNNGSISGQTLYDNGTGSQSVSSGIYRIYQDDALKSSNVRFDFAGQVADFIIDCDLMITGTHMRAAIIYRTTYWSSADNSYAYILQIKGDPGTVMIHRASNSSNTSSSTELWSATTTVITNTWYHVRLVVVGGTHTVYWNNSSTALGSTTDTKFLSAGYVGARAYNNHNSSGSPSKFDNFVMVPYTQPAVWTSASHSISAVGAAGGSQISWGPDSSGGAETLAVSTSINGGSTWQACSNGGTIPGITTGMNVSGLSVKVKASFSTSDLTQLPVLSSLVWNVVQQYASAGSRTSQTLIPVSSPYVARAFGGTVPLPAGNNIPYLGGASISWKQETPLGSSVNVNVSTDRGNTWDALASGDDLPGLISEQLAIVDNYSVDSSQDYSTVFWGNVPRIFGGTVALYGGLPVVMSIDTVNHRLALTGGQNAAVLWNKVDTADGDIYCVVGQSNNSGIVFRYIDINNYYQAHVIDSAGVGTPQTLFINKRVNAVTTQIVAPIAINFIRGAYHTLHVSFFGPLITCFWDGVQVAQVADTDITSVGNIGYLNDGGIAYWYNILAREAGSPLSGVGIQTQVNLSTTDATQTPIVSDFFLTVRAPGIDTGSLSSTSGSKNTKMCDGMLSDFATQSDLWWNINELRGLLFTTVTRNPSPIVISSANGDILMARQPTVIYNTPLYRNRQFITDAIDTIPVSDIRKGDGTTTTWNLRYPVYGKPTMLLNGAIVTVGELGVEHGKNFYFTTGSPSIIQDATNTVLLSTDILTISYNGGIDYTAIANDVAQQQLIASLDHSSGIIATTESGKGTLQAVPLMRVDADALAQARLTQYAKLATAFQFSTLREGLAAGQYLTVFFPEGKIINHQYFITGIQASTMLKSDGGILYTYDVSCTDGAIIGSWHKFFNYFKKR